MIDSLVQQFLGGGGESLQGPDLHQGVGQMVQQAPNESVFGAVGNALDQLGPQGFGQSVAHGAQHASPEARNSMADMLMQAVSQGGGSPANLLSELGGGGSQMGPGELGQLAATVAERHPGELQSILGSQLNQQGGSGGGLMQLLGNPMVRQVGMHLAQKVFS